MFGRKWRANGKTFRVCAVERDARGRWGVIVSKDVGSYVLDRHSTSHLAAENVGVELFGHDP